MKKRLQKVICSLITGAVCFGVGAAIMDLNTATASADTVNFSMQAGASIRLTAGSTGIRFVARMEDEMYDTLIDASGETPVYKAGMSLGMVIVPTDYIENAPAGTSDWLSYIGDKKKLTLEIPAEKVYEKDGAWCFNGVMTNIQFNSMDMDFIGIAYSYDGTAYDYADFNIEDNSRSVALVASRALADTEANYGETTQGMLRDFVTQSLYREAGVYAYNKDGENLYYASYEDYKADTERVNGETDIDVVADALGYELEYIKVAEEKNIALADGETTIDFVSAVDGADYSNLIEWSSSNTNVATVVNGTVNVFGVGETVVTAKLFGEEYKTTVGVATKLIASATDFAAIANNANGYYIMTKDIDFNGATLNSLFAETAGAENHAPTASVGFLGTFDGRGHTLKNMELASSLFGTIGRTGVVKNTSFSTNKLTGASVIAKFHYGVIDNVQVTVAATGADNTSTYPAYGLVVEQVQGYSGAQYQYGVVSNVYLNASKLFYAAWGERALVTRWDTGYYANFSNIVVVASQFHETYLPIVKAKNASSKYENNVAYTSTSGLADFDFSTFNDYWVFDENNVPTMKAKVVEPVGPQKPVVTLKNQQVVLASGENLVIDFAEEATAVCVGGTEILSFTSNGTTLTIPFAELSQITPNDYELTVETAEKTYTAKIAIITKVLMTADFVTSSNNMTGYYVLGENITLGAFSGLTSGTFSGIFDGRGYTISGATFQAGTGLLGKTASNTTVRNLAVVNCGYIGGTSAGLVSEFTGATKIENVFVSLNKPAGWANSNGVLSFKTSGAMELNNVITYLADKWGANTGSLVQWVVNTEDSIVGTNSFSGSNTGVLQVHTLSGSCTGVGHFETLAAMQAAYAAKTIDVSWAQGFAFYNTLVAFLTA